MTKIWTGLRSGLTVLLAVFRSKPSAEAPAAAGPPPPPPWIKSYPAGLSWQADIPATPVPTLLDEAVTNWPANPCLEFLDFWTGCPIHASPNNLGYPLYI